MIAGPHSTFSADAFTMQTDSPQQQHTSLLMGDPHPHDSDPTATSASIERHAIDSTGQSGSFYDAASDRVIPCTTRHTALESITLAEPAIGQLFRGDQTSLDTLLQRIGIEDELRLSLYLDLTDPAGIARIVNHGHPFDRHTRIFHYSWKHNRTTFRPTNAMVETMEEWWQSPSEATHRITSVTNGIELLLVVHPRPEMENLSTVDDLLIRLSKALVENGTDLDKICPDQKRLFDCSAYHDVYSNDPTLRRDRCLSDVFQLIYRMKNGRERGHPIKYHLEPLNSLSWIFRLCFWSSRSWYPLDRELTQQILDMVAKPFHVLKTLDNFWNANNHTVLRPYLQDHFNQGHQELTQLRLLYRDLIRELRPFIIHARDAQQTTTNIEIRLHNGPLLQLRERITEATIRAIDLLNSAYLISERRKVGLEYEDGKQYDFPDNAGVSSVKSIRMEDDADPSGSTRLRHELIQIEENDRDVRAVSVDFYSNHSLSNMLTLPPPGPKTINILLIGQTGVGKSTFINALANYLRFSSLQQALTEPVVVIPVSFLITTGFNFDEKVLYFGECENRENEDFNEQGHSVTQQCQNYEFDLPSRGGKRIRIIDTPGLGDTRGIEQDQMNIDHIKKYVNEQQSLDAVCFLLKPNEARASILFRTCFYEYMKLFGENFGGKLLFCFTNGRSTFYAPGDTGPMLRKLLAELPSTKISMQKSNTFVFDNESFRYLVARRNEITFTDDETHDYEESWRRSVKEATRLLSTIVPE